MDSVNLWNGESSCNEWKQAVVFEDFDAALLTPDCEFVVDFTGSKGPFKHTVEMIFQGMDGGPEWARVSPVVEMDGKAYFRYTDIIGAWGGEDFALLHKVYVGDAGCELCVTNVAYNDHPTAPKKGLEIKVDKKKLLIGAAAVVAGVLLLKKLKRKR
jgi:hypothetical protein